VAGHWENTVELEENPIKYYEATWGNTRDGHENDWLMLGHAVNNGDEILVLKEGPLVRRASRWRRCWLGARGSKPLDFEVFIPESDDPDFVACGVVFVSQCQNLVEPRADFPVGLVHKSLVELAPLTEELWYDECANQGITLNIVPNANTAWPSKASLIGIPPSAYRIKNGVVRRAQISGGNLIFTEDTPVCALPLRIRNTFIDIHTQPEFGDFYLERKVRSWPSSPRNSHLPELCDGVPEFTLDAGAGVDDQADASSDIRSPSTSRASLFQFLSGFELCNLIAVCRTAKEWLPETMAESSNITSGQSFSCVGTI